MKIYLLHATQFKIKISQQLHLHKRESHKKLRFPFPRIIDYAKIFSFTKEFKYTHIEMWS